MEERNDRSASTTRRCLLAIFCGRTSLLVLMTGYALLGAILFETIEGGEEHDVPHDFQKSREECLKELWLITERLNVLYEKNWTKLVTEQLKRFEKTVVESGKADGIVNSSRPHWTFGGALLYSVTLLTTVGYGKLSPKTALGKVAAIIYAIIGVPLMLILLSALGSLLASGARKCYSKLCCQNQSARIKSPSVGYHKAPTSPGKHCSKTHDDTTTIQLPSAAQATPNHVNCSNHFHQQQQPYPEPQEVPKRAVLATVRTNRTRSWCRQMPPVRQTLADPQVPQPCPAHSHGTPVKASMNSTIVGITASSDLEDAEDTDENEHVCSHDTPSRVPLIWRCPEEPSSPKRRGRRGRAGPGYVTATAATTAAHPQDLPPSVPALLVLTIFVSYVCAGAVAFSSTSGWSFLDAVYFCFVALSTIGVSDRLPQGDELDAQLQLYAYCLYLIVGLVIVSMCFSLVQEEVAVRCRQFANSVGLIRH